MKIIKQSEAIMECCNDYKTMHVYAKWDGCCDIRRYYNGYTYEDTDVPNDDIDYIHICDLREFINFLTEIADKAEQIKGFEGYEKSNCKEVKVICPKCGAVMAYKNWLSWIWHTPFHWFGKRKAKCAKCGEVSYIGRERDK